ncbi:pYEATS domain-containing protein [Amycolatopsis anabasis]|uniref:pYEATS domain-containing protein n=1 Tax=Amycolatopsis anabasis TaxID=1840409 RepID=UPI00131EBBCC|nr:pYEATS domain-containing protein [Amycolatopsis anabasis]
MRDWIPLFQSLVWPVLVAVLAFRFRGSLRGLADIVASRVAQGASFEAGASDRGSYRYHSIHVFLVGDDDRELDREVTDRATNFGLRTSAWGMFNLSADVHVAGRSRPLRLERYINF